MSPFNDHILMMNLRLRHFSSNALAVTQFNKVSSFELGTITRSVDFKSIQLIGAPIDDVEVVWKAVSGIALLLEEVNRSMSSPLSAK